MKYIKQYESKKYLKISDGDYVKLKFKTPLSYNDRQKIFKVLGNYHDNSAPEAEDGGTENLFLTINAIDGEETRTFHKDFLRKLTKKELEKFELEQSVKKYNL